MKKEILLCLAGICVLLSLCGCADRPQSEVKQRQRLVIGSDNYIPYNYRDDEGRYQGIDVELAKEVCKRISYEPVFRQIIWDQKDEYLREGQVDCLWGSFSMNGREEEYDWAGPYMYSRQMVVVRKHGKIHSLKDLEGKRLAVQATTKPEKVLLEHSDQSVPAVSEVCCLTTMDEVYASLRNGFVDGIAGHESAMVAFMNTDPSQYEMLSTSLYISALGVAFQKGEDEALLKKIEKAFKEMKEDGTMTAIVKKYGLDEGYALGGQ